MSFWKWVGAARRLARGPRRLVRSGQSLLPHPEELDPLSYDEPGELLPYDEPESNEDELPDDELDRSSDTGVGSELAVRSVGSSSVPAGSNGRLVAGPPWRLRSTGRR
ncbi:hypothetical protein I0C86_41585 [Plantactinospora sp. S1510]|uniref:Uncharacterized protein n=1 Tax=Plantactinospora alkalitolerans TaxID=2789879 RepID=A0ABS0HAM0_9ACTN|nr:hypothetical protein [Plantactinospora alkalitolerans]MBF9135346.1 hypothetical protein [Plantactinospora alkalitolerans]